jgi:DNA-binding response OmpR family regulator
MRHVLLIEDNPSDVFLVREAIRRSPIPADVIVACDGAEALRFLESPDPPPDLVILDLNLPRRSGIEILQRHPPNGGPPIVVFTGSHNHDEREQALELGAKEHIVKPDRWDDYIATIHGVIERWSRNGYIARNE